MVMFENTMTVNEHPMKNKGNPMTFNENTMQINPRKMIRKPTIAK